MSDFTKRLRQIESENSECSILAGNCADAIEIEQKKVAIEIALLRAENEKLRAACQSIKIMFETKWSWSSQHKIDIACREIAAALKEATND